MLPDTPEERDLIRPAIALAFALIAAPAVAQDCSRTSDGTAALAAYPAVRAFYDSMTLGDADLVDCAVGPEWLNNPAAPGTPTGPEGFKPAVYGLQMLFGQYAFTTEDVIASGDRIVVRSTVTARQIGPFLGVPPSDNVVTFQTIDIHQLGPDGKLAQSWHVEDWLSYLMMQGALPLKSE